MNITAGGVTQTRTFTWSGLDMISATNPEAKRAKRVSLNCAVFPWAYFGATQLPIAARHTLTSTPCR